MTVLVDSSVWIDYFRSGKNSGRLDILIDENIVVTNDLILTEMVPYLMLHNQSRLIDLFNTIYKIELIIQWDQLIDWQYRCLKQGLNGIGITDLIIAQNAVQNNCVLYSMDSHFKLIETIVKIELY